VRKMRDAHPRDLGLSPRLPAFLLGFMATSFQVYLLREFSAAFYGNELTFGLFLGSWLLWGGLGSLARPKGRLDPWAARLAGLYGCAIALFFASLAVLRFSHKLMGILPAELTGLVPAFGFALLLGLLLSFPLGHFFVLNAGFLGGDVASVYVRESAGAATAGLLVHFLLVPHLSNWEGAAAVGAAAAVLVLAGMKPARINAAVPAAALLFAAGLVWFDLPTQRWAWKPLSLIEAEDTRYGKLQVIRNVEQVTFFDNGLTVFSHPDVGAAEESVHFALLQRDGARRVLIVGGGVGGGAAEALKHPGVRVDCVELDPAVIRLARKHLSGEALAALESPRVRLFHSDGRSFLERTADRYDAVLLNLPAPATAQVNRYYTREFFLEVRNKLAPDGVFGFVVPSAENYISASLGQLLSSLAATLRGVFRRVVAVPGSTCVFLASDGPLTIDADLLARAVAGLGLETRLVSPGMLPARLDPARVDYLEGKLAAPDARINRDLVPVCYYFHSLLWAGQFRGIESRILRFAGRVPPVWLLDAPLAVFALALAGLAWKGRRSPARHLVPVAVMGLTSIVVEVAVFIAFQANFGFVYGRIPLLLALFMAGMVIGSLAARRRRRPGRADLPAVQAGFVVLLLVASGTLSGTGGESVPFALLLGFGALGGYLFVSANRRLIGKTPHPGLAYGVDLLASFAGAILASTLLIPLFGVPAVILRLTILNFLCFLFLLATAFSEA
jgi:spermidine synthase